MTPTNAARDALERLRQNGSMLPQRIQSKHWQDTEVIRTLLTALSAVDFELLGAALNSLDKKKAKAVYPEVAFACIDPVDFVALEKAARLVLSLGKDQKIDPLAGTPDGLVSE